MKQIVIGFFSLVCLSGAALQCQAQWGRQHPAHGGGVVVNSYCGNCSQQHCNAPVAHGCATNCCRPGLFARIRQRRQNCCHQCTPAQCTTSCRPGLFGRIRQRIGQRRCCTHQAYAAPVCQPAPTWQASNPHDANAQPAAPTKSLPQTKPY